MNRWLALVTACLVATPLVVASARGAGDELPRLIGTVGPGFTIDLTDAAGTHVDTVVAGTYELLVRDLSDMHNFAMGNKAGGGLFVDSGVEFVGEKTFTIALVPGRYGYACSPHWQIMNGSLTVVAPSPPPPPPPPPAPAPRSLTATVPARGPVVVSSRSVAPGRYVIVVRDRSTTRNLRLVGPGVTRRTGKPFVGTVRWNLTLTRGTYRYGSEPLLAGRLVVR